MFDIQEGDVVVLPLMTQTGLVALGRITGPYAYREVGGIERHTRRVEWIRTDVPRTDFGQDLQDELSRRRTVRRIQSNDAERRIAAMLDGSRDPNIDTTEADTDEPTQAPLESVEAPPYTLQDIIADGCFLKESKLETILNPHFPYQPCRACRNQQRNYPM